MKVYIKAVSIEDMRKQYSEMPEPDFIELINVDPTADYASGKRGKYMPWIFKQNKLGNLPVEQYHNVHDALILFAKDSSAFPIKDLNQYKTVDDFLHAFDVAVNNPTPLSKRQKQREDHKKVKQALMDDSNGEFKFLVSDGDWEVYTPNTFAGSIALAEVGCDKTKPYLYPQADADNMKARWCTAANEGYYNRYTRQGPLYIFINRNDPINKYQSCPASQDWWYNKDDREQGRRAFFKFCDEHPAIKDFFEIRTLNGINYMQDKMLGFDPEATDINLPTDFKWEWDIPNSVVNLYIPDEVEITDNRWHCNCRGLGALKTVRLPETMKEIPAEFFSDCTSLEEITIPNSVKVYGRRAFSDCTALKTINHSQNLTIVRDECFVRCVALTSQLPDSVKYVGKDVFYMCSNIDPIQMPANTNRIISESFKDTTVNGVELNNVTAVGPNAFNGSSISYIDISKLTQIGSGAFRHCTNLQVVELNKDEVKIGSYAFADNPIDGVITVPESAELSLSVFDNCPNLTINWDKADEPYEFEDIRLLICSKDCKELIKANKGYIPIEISEDGTRYEVE